MFDRDDYQILRDDNQAALDELGRVPDAPPEGAPRIAAVTIKITTYPTTASVFYGVRAVAILGDQVEGQPAIEEDSGETYLAFNLGTKIPPVGSKVELTRVPHRWVFTYGKPAIVSVTPATTPETPTSPPYIPSPEAGTGTGSMFAGPSGAVMANGYDQGVPSSLSFGLGSLTEQETSIGYGRGTVVGFAPGTLGTVGEGRSSTLVVGVGSITPGPVTITGTGRASTIAVGAGSLTGGSAGVSGTGIASTLAVGSGSLTPGVATITAVAIAPALAVGTGSTTPGPITIAGTGRASTLAVGTGSVITATNQTITATGRASTLAFGVGSIGSRNDNPGGGA
ncbi:MAG: hypothetical protein M3P94_07240 [Chloroflexota bacterium]|nr:hypothetical protein [Chloroflexota bacterium]